MDFRIIGLSPDLFRPLYGLSDAELAARGVERVRVDQPHAAPCRIGLDDIPPGGWALLLNHEHQPADTPYRSRHAIFVEEGAETAFDRVGEIPPALRRRTLSLRAFDAAHRMIDADLIEGAQAERLLLPMLTRPDTAYVQIHYARRGCYAARTERV
ncbi:DUF1203 domain-containing protein [Brevundimonas sp.]|uniref:DUF1203 domain-containing protein n=1 Tax=Brevundimonas sp. TaxID=1871086 RepID=UPI0025E95014|nr:DUF1203 domain-containing protein [Brevundimonas sp.]